VRLLRVGRKYVVRADDYLAALERQGVTPEVTRESQRDVLPSVVPVDPAAAVRAALGLKLKAGAR
jgi:hypothetical protein